jgi:small subunit ribosomal protein S1
MLAKQQGIAVAPVEGAETAPVEELVVVGETEVPPAIEVEEEIPVAVEE